MRVAATSVARALEGCRRQCPPGMKRMCCGCDAAEGSPGSGFGEKADRRHTSSSAYNSPITADPASNVQFPLPPPPPPCTTRREKSSNSRASSPPPETAGAGRRLRQRCRDARRRPPPAQRQRARRRNRGGWRPRRRRLATPRRRQLGVGEEAVARLRCGGGGRQRCAGAAGAGAVGAGGGGDGGQACRISHLAVCISADTPDVARPRVRRREGGGGVGFCELLSVRLH